MSIRRCSVCDEMLFEWRLPHACPPRWEAVVHGFNDADAPVDFYSGALNVEQVAEAFADRMHSHLDYCREMEVWVREGDQYGWQKFNVVVEMVPSFIASRIEGGA